MQAMPALASALFRHLGEERIEYCVLGEVLEQDSRNLASAAPVSIDLVVQVAAAAQIPAILKTFCGRSEMELVQHRNGAGRKCAVM